MIVEFKPTPEESNPETKPIDNEIARLRAILPPRRFDTANPPPKLEPTYWIGGVPVATAGNLCAIQSKAKVGKSAFCGALIAAAFDDPGDCLSVEGGNPDGRALIHFDSEQSPQDHFAVVDTALKRAEVESCPPWLRSYSLVDVPSRDRLALLSVEVDAAASDCGGVLAILIDGVADYISDPNDAAEAFAVVEYLHAMAVKNSCVIWLVLHENPGSENGKTRGHLGSQLERKAETNVRLERDSEGVTTIFFDRARHGFLSKDDGPRFRWDTAAGMHVSVAETRREVDQIRRDREGRTMAEGVIRAIWGNDPARTVPYNEFISQVADIEGVSKETAKRRIRVIRGLTLARKSELENGWVLTPEGRIAVTLKEAL